MHVHCAGQAAGCRAPEECATQQQGCCSIGSAGGLHQCRQECSPQQTHKGDTLASSFCPLCLPTSCHRSEVPCTLCRQKPECKMRHLSLCNHLCAHAILGERAASIASLRTRCPRHDHRHSDSQIHPQVGFVSQLPHLLVKAFHSTLEASPPLHTYCMPGKLLCTLCAGGATCGCFGTRTRCSCSSRSV